MAMLRIRLAVMTGLLLLAQGCGNGVATQGFPGGQASGFVTFTVKVPTAAFSERQPVTVSIWDETQLAIAASTSGCTASSSGDGQTHIQCPPGVTYRKATPETRQVTVAELRQGLTIASTTVATGERYRVTLGGRASDECNQAGATAEGTARSQTISLVDLEVYQTMMACGTPPPQPPQQ